MFRRLSQLRNIKLKLIWRDLIEKNFAYSSKYRSFVFLLMPTSLSLNPESWMEYPLWCPPTLASSRFAHALRATSHPWNFWRRTYDCISPMQLLQIHTRQISQFSFLKGSSKYSGAINSSVPDSLRSIAVHDNVCMVRESPKSEILARYPSPINTFWLLRSPWMRAGFCWWR